MLVLAADYDNLMHHHVHTFVTLYALTFFFSNFGPNATTFIIPAELFPTAWRSTAHGLSAASGKAGAIVGAFGFLYASQPSSAAEAAPYPPGIGMRASLALMAAINLCGLLCTFLIPETLGRSLEELCVPARRPASARCLTFSFPQESGVKLLILRQRQRHRLRRLRGHQPGGDGHAPPAVWTQRPGALGPVGARAARCRFGRHDMSSRRCGWW